MFQAYDFVAESDDIGEEFSSSSDGQSEEEDDLPFDMEPLTPKVDR
jgi:hypothetical protein